MVEERGLFDRVIASAARPSSAFFNVGREHLPAIMASVIVGKVLPTYGQLELKARRRPETGPGARM
jgi:hypothetical protein